MGQYLEEKPVLGSQSTTAQAKLQAKLASGASKLQKKLSGSGVVAAESDRTAEVTRLPEQEELPEYLENNYVGREHSEKVATGPRLGEPRRKGATHPNAGEGEKIQKRTLKWMKEKGIPGSPGLQAMKDREEEHRARNKSGVSEAATPESGTGKYYDEKNPTPAQLKNRQDRAEVRRLTNAGKHKEASYLHAKINKKSVSYTHLTLPTKA